MIIDSINGEHGHKYVLSACLNEEEVKAILPEMIRIIKKAQKKSEYYNDIHEMGEMTERQENARLEANDKYLMLCDLKAQMEDYLRLIEKDKIIIKNKMI